MMQALNRIDAEGLPAPSAELTILAALVHAHLKTISPKKRRMFLDLVEATVLQHESQENITRLRPSLEEAERAKTHREAVAWLRTARAVFQAIEREEDHW